MKWQGDSSGVYTIAKIALGKGFSKSKEIFFLFFEMLLPRAIIAEL
jgi:hypothetical protein